MKIIKILPLLICLLFLNGCILLAGTAGAAGGYYAAKHVHEHQSNGRNTIVIDELH